MNDAFSEDSKPVALRIVEHGAVRVHSAYVHRESPEIVCIYMDLHSKYVDQPTSGGGHNEPPALYFMAGEHALHLDETKPRDSITIVEFPEYIGWQVFACDAPSRYTVSIVLTRENVPHD